MLRNTVGPILLESTKHPMSQRKIGYVTLVGTELTVSRVKKGVYPRSKAFYSKPQEVGNRIKYKWCWDSLYVTLKD